MSSVPENPFAATAFNRQQQLKRNVNISSRLQSTGVSAEIDLPQICVLGSQSAGKSSLIESISTIALPRASGTCTRCPTECTLSNSDDPWRCDVYLRFKYDSYNRPLTGGQKQDMAFGGTLHTREEVQDRVRRAQLAILNPKLDDPNFPHSFLTSEPPSQSEITFSRNTIVLKVSGPDIVDLSFVDLPGIIATTVNGTKDDIEAVRDLACEYVKNPNAIILLTVTCETDADNQGAYELVKEYDPDGSRTIGVATKPDRIENGQEDAWFRLLRNEVMRVQNSWYCVKLPGPEQLRQKISWRDARLHENEFFLHGPWASQADLLHRLGVPKLVERLGTLLSEHVQRTLPDLLAKISAKIDEYKAEAGKLPSPPDAKPVRVITQLIVDFQRQVDVEIAGTISENGLIQKMNAHANVFRHRLRGSAPRFIPFKVGQECAFRQGVPPILFLPEEERDLGDVGSHPVLYLCDVEKRARDAISRELPGNVPFAMKKEMIQNAIQLWREPAEVLLDSADSVIAKHFSTLCNQHFKHYKVLRHHVIAKLNRHRSACGKLARDRVDWILEVEHQATFSLNALYHLSYRRNFETFYKSVRWSYRWRGEIVKRLPASKMAELETSSAPADEDVEAEETLSLPCAAEPAEPCSPYVMGSPVDMVESDAPKRARLIRQLESGDPTNVPELIKLIPAESSDQAIEILADVRAYWQVAFKRCVDYIPLAIDMELVRGFGKDLSGLLFQELGISGPDADKKCAEYLAEPLEVVIRREELQGKLKYLEDARDAIEDWRVNGV